MIREWAGEDRPFLLTFGGVLDLEEVLDREGIALIYRRIARGEYRARDVVETIRIGLIGGGMDKMAARRLLEARRDIEPIASLGMLAGEILNAAMMGIEADESDAAEDPEEATIQPYKFSEVAQISRVFHMSPRDVLEMPYSDFVNLLRGFNAGGGQAEYLSEAEFDDILARFEPDDEEPVQ